MTKWWSPVFVALLLALRAAAAPVGRVMHLTSSDFSPDGELPTFNPCEGADHAPGLVWVEVSPATKSFALILDDPDTPNPAARKMAWLHWVVHNLPASARGLAPGPVLPAGAHDRLSDWKQPGWRGPCPPIGRHRCFFKLYALDAMLADLKQPTEAPLEQVMQAHVLARAELVGTYQKHKAC